MSEEKKSILLRAYLVYIIVLIFGVAIVGKIIYLQFAEGEYWARQASVVNSRTEVVEPLRGNIYADDESLLATSVPMFEVRIDLDSAVIPDKEFSAKIDSLVYKLCMLFDGNTLNRQTLKRDILKARKSQNRGFLIRRKATYSELKQMKTFPILRNGSRGGLIVITRDRRERPYKNLAAMTIGYERLAQFRVEINFKAGRKVTRQNFLRYADTLAICFHNLFLDNTVGNYKKLLEKNYLDGKKALITRNMNEIQLAELKTFPLIEDDTSGMLKIQKLVNAYYVGLEGHYRNQLRGERGVITLKKVGNNSWKKISDEDYIEPLNGCDLYTSIDVNLQDVAENALRRCLDSNNAFWGCAVLMEVQTGYIKAITNLKRDGDGVYREMRNYAVEELIEPGSTFKLASVIAVLEDGAFDTAAIVNTGKISYPGWGTVVDSHEEGYGRVSLTKAFEKSSNVGITEIVRKAFGKNPAKLQMYIEKMGLMQKTGIDLDNEPQPRIKVTYGDLLGIAFGYAMKVTPLQMLAFYNAIANNGKYVRPVLVEEIKRTGIPQKRNEPVVVKEQVCSPTTLRKVRRLLEGVVDKGTAKNISNSVYKIAGKTGTAKIYDPSARAYVKNYIASFAGYFPAEEPKYSCIVVVYNPQGSEYYGSQIAAPVFKEIADKVYATRVDIKSKQKEMPEQISVPEVPAAYGKDVNIIYDMLNLSLVSTGNLTEWVTVKRGGNSLNVSSRPVVKGPVFPDVRGMVARDAVYILESMGFQVTVSGTGRVTAQKPAPGEKPGTNRQVYLQLSSNP